MEDVKALAMLLGNLGGVGAMAYCLFVLHREAIKSFREELQAERKAWQEALQYDRNERLAGAAMLRSESVGNHREVIERLVRIESEIAVVRQICEE